MAINELNLKIHTVNEISKDDQPFLIKYFEINYGEEAFKTDLEQVMLLHKIIEVNSMNINHMQMVMKLTDEYFKKTSRFFTY